MQTTLPFGLLFWCGFVELIALVAVVIGCAWRGLPVPGRKAAVAIAASWVVIITVEFWAAGPWSFVPIADEGEVFVPLYIYMVKWFMGGTFAHGVGGGGDALTINAVGNSFLSLERTLFQLLPPWVVIGVNKLSVAALAVGGGYILARRGAGADRLSALALGFAFSLAHRAMIKSSVGVGISFGITPLAIYFFVFRLERRYYWPCVIAVAALHAISCAPMSSSPQLGLAIFIAWIFTGAKNPKRFIGAVTLLIMLAALNWAEVLYAFFQGSAESDLITRDKSFEAAYALSLFFTGRAPESMFLGIACIAVLIARRWELGLKAALMLGCAAVTPVLSIVPWSDLGIPFLSAYKFMYFAYAIPPLIILVGGWASVAWGAPVGSMTPWRRLVAPATLMLAVGVGQMAWHKLFTLAEWVGMGGQSIYVRYLNLVDRPWQPDHPFRVVTIPYRINPDTTAAYGLESFDSLVQNRMRSVAQYWRDGMPNSNSGIGSPYAYVVSQNKMDFLCCDTYAIDKILTLDALRAANVEFIISVLPLESPNLTKVSGPVDGTVPPRRADPLMRKLRSFASLMFSYEQVYVYRLGRVVPRAWMAAATAAVPSGLEGPELQRAYIEAALRRAALVSEPRSLPVSDGTVRDIRYVPDGYELVAEGTKDGTLVINTPYSLNWKVLIDGVEAPAMPANGIHMAVAVPAGSHRVEFLYRPKRLFRD